MGIPSSTSQSRQDFPLSCHTHPSEDHGQFGLGHTVYVHTHIITGHTGLGPVPGHKILMKDRTRKNLADTVQLSSKQVMSLIIPRQNIRPSEKRLINSLYNQFYITGQIFFLSYSLNPGQGAIGNVRNYPHCLINGILIGTDEEVQIGQKQNEKGQIEVFKPNSQTHGTSNIRNTINLGNILKPETGFQFA